VPRQRLSAAGTLARLVKVLGAVVPVLVLLTSVAACGAGDGAGTPPMDRAAPPTTGPTVTTTTEPDPGSAPEPQPAPQPEPEPSTGPDAGGRDPRPVRVRIDRRVADEATADFEEVAVATLTDPRGWQRAGFELTFGDDAPYTLVLAEASEVDALCRPYDTGGRYSCQNGPVVALNADRWRTATPQWTGDLDSYRQMLVNHEVGHLLGEHHPSPQCPGPGQPAPVMAQQSTSLGECLPNPWPLQWEIDCATHHPGPLAPPPDPTGPTLRCTPDGPTN
jgi:hypothetical protein